MAKYIDSAAFLDAIERMKPYHQEADDIAEMLQNFPAADVRPVPEGGIGEMSDGYHTFNGLYYQRMVLFAALVNAYQDKAWKSWKHEDGELCFGGGWFIVGIDTPKGSYTYHYEEKYWNWFECKELPAAKHWDGHTEEDVRRLLSLVEGRGEVMPMYDELVKHLRKLQYMYATDYVRRTIREAADAIEKLSVDVRPVMRGKWVKARGSWCTPGGDPVWECSECGKGRHVYGIEHGSYGADVADGQWVACPNCGAKMDGES